MMMLWGDGSGQIPVVLGVVWKLWGNSIEPQFDQPAHAVVSPW
jgi:hypothetical protein